MKYYLTTPLYYVNAAPHIGHSDTRSGELNAHA